MTRDELERRWKALPHKRRRLLGSSHGYSTHEVDAFLKRVSDALWRNGASGLSRDELTDVTFASENGGYACDAVDRLLDELADAAE